MKKNKVKSFFFHVFVGVFVILIASGVAFGFTSAIRIAVLEEKYYNVREIVKEIRRDVKWIRENMRGEKKI